MSSEVASRLTIAVPFYRDADYLRQAVSSIFAQPASNWSVLMVDNSTDEQERRGASEIAAAYPKDRMRYVRNDRHLGAAENFNRCIDLAESDLVSTVHSDDEVLPGYAAELQALASRHPDAAILFAPARIINERSEPYLSFVDWFKNFLMPRGSGDIVLCGEASLRSIARGNWLNGASVCFRKSRLGSLRWDASYSMAADLDLWSRVILTGGAMAGTRYPPVYSYRRHTGQATAALSANLHRFAEEAQVLDRIADGAAAKGWGSAAAVARAKKILQLHLLFLMAGDLAAGSFSRVRYKLGVFNSIRRTSRAR